MKSKTKKLEKVKTIKKNTIFNNTKNKEENKITIRI